MLFYRSVKTRERREVKVLPATRSPVLPADVKFRAGWKAEGSQLGIAARAHYKRLRMGAFQAAASTPRTLRSSCSTVNGLTSSE